MENETVKTVEEPTSIEPVIPVIQVTEPIKEEVVKPEPVVEQPKQEVVQPEKVEPKVESPKSPEITPIQSLVGQLATIDINDMDNEGEIDALLTQVFRISSDAENIAQQLAEMQN